MADLEYTRCIIPIPVIQLPTSTGWSSLSRFCSELGSGGINRTNISTGDQRSLTHIQGSNYSFKVNTNDISAAMFLFRFAGTDTTDIPIIAA